MSKEQVCTCSAHVDVGLGEGPPLGRRDLVREACSLSLERLGSGGLSEPQPEGQPPTLSLSLSRSLSLSLPRPLSRLRPALPPRGRRAQCGSPALPEH